jgi:hypothetical protein
LNFIPHPADHRIITAPAARCGGRRPPPDPLQDPLIRAVERATIPPRSAARLACPKNRAGGSRRASWWDRRTRHPARKRRLNPCLSTVSSAQFSTGTRHTTKNKVIHWRNAKSAWSRHKAPSGTTRRRTPAPQIRGILDESATRQSTYAPFGLDEFSGGFSHGRSNRSVASTAGSTGGLAPGAAMAP